MIPRPRLPLSTYLTVVACAAAVMTIHTGPLIPYFPETREAGMTHARSNTTEAPHLYVGMWVTADGHVRHELLANGRYDEQRGTRKSAYRGRYAIIGDHIDYVDDTGFTADGDFVDGVLHHAGMILYREQ